MSFYLKKNMSQKHVCPCKVLEKINATNNWFIQQEWHVYHGLPNGTPFAAQEDDRGISYHFDPVQTVYNHDMACFPTAKTDLCLLGGEGTWCHLNIIFAWIPFRHWLWWLSWMQSRRIFIRLRLIVLCLRWYSVSGAQSYVHLCLQSGVERLPSASNPSPSAMNSSSQNTKRLDVPQEMPIQTSCPH